MSLRTFEKETFSPQVIVTKTAAYTALVTDDQINITGNGVILTLPSLLSFQGTMMQKKLYNIYNNGATYDLTVQPGTNANTGVADTINTLNTWTVKPNETIIISGESNLTNWSIISPYTVPALYRQPFAVCVTVASSATATPTNVFNANGAPVNLDITEVYVNSLDAVAATITLNNGTSAVCTVAKGTVAQVLTPAGTITYPAVLAGAALTVVSSASGYARVTIIGTTQTITIDG